MITTAIPPKHQHHPTTGQQPHVSLDAQRAGRCDAYAQQVNHSAHIKTITLNYVNRRRSSMDRTSAS